MESEDLFIKSKYTIESKNLQKGGRIDFQISSEVKLSEIASSVGLDVGVHITV